MPHSFGGDWTEDKLAVMRRYFAAYAQALKNQTFAKWYVDAFAGSGERTEGKVPCRTDGGFFGDETGDLARVKQGSVRIALGIEPPFARYVLIERLNEHAASLELLKAEFPGRVMDVIVGDANATLRRKG